MKSLQNATAELDIAVFCRALRYWAAQIGLETEGMDEDFRTEFSAIATLTYQGRTFSMNSHWCNFMDESVILHLTTDKLDEIAGGHIALVVKRRTAQVEDVCVIDPGLRASGFAWNKRGSFDWWSQPE